MTRFLGFQKEICFVCGRTGIPEELYADAFRF